MVSYSEQNKSMCSLSRLFKSSENFVQCVKTRRIDLKVIQCLCLLVFDLVYKDLNCVPVTKDLPQIASILFRHL